MRQTNAKVRDLIEEYNTAQGNYADDSKKFVFIDLDRWSQERDYKHLLTDSSRIWIQPQENLPLPTDPAKRVYLDNRALTFREPPIELGNNMGMFTALDQGGIFSFDNMHLTPPGYGLLATEVLQTIARNERLTETTAYRRGAALIAPHTLLELRTLRQDNFLRTGTAQNSVAREWISEIVFGGTKTRGK